MTTQHIQPTETMQQQLRVYGAEIDVVNNGKTFNEWATEVDDLICQTLHVTTNKICFPYAEQFINGTTAVECACDALGQEFRQIRYVHDQLTEAALRGIEAIQILINECRNVDDEKAALIWEHKANLSRAALGLKEVQS